VTLKAGLGSLKVIENYTNRSGTHNFLLMFYSSDRPISYRFRDNRRIPPKIDDLYISVYLVSLAEGVPLGNGYRRKG